MELEDRLFLEGLQVVIFRLLVQASLKIRAQNNRNVMDQDIQTQTQNPLLSLRKWFAAHLTNSKQKILVVRSRSPQHFFQ